MDMSTTTASMKEAFPILARGHYVNHAAISPWPKVTSEAVQAFAKENSETGPQHYRRWLRREKLLRDSLAMMIKAPSGKDIALMKNTTDCICTVANGVRWQNGDNVVIPAGEFPSNRLPWLALRDQGVEVREVDIHNTDAPEDALLAQMDKNTRLLSVSAVQWADGLRLDLKKLGSACQGTEILFFVDAIQLLGALDINVQACHIDFLAADGHKWLLAPEGIAVFYSNLQARNQLRLVQHGWHMTDNPYQFNRHDWSASESASRFEAGTPNMLGQVGFNASVQLLLEYGMAQIDAAVSANSAQISAAIENIAGANLIMPYDPQRSSGIVCFDVPGTPLPDLLAALAEQQVTCTIRGGGIRLSPHFYQAGKPIAELLDIVEQVILRK